MTSAGVGSCAKRGSVRIGHSPPSMSIFTRSASAIGGSTSRAGWSGASALICDSAKPPVANGSSVSSVAATTWMTCHCGCGRGGPAQERCIGGVGLDRGEPGRLELGEGPGAEQPDVAAEVEHARVRGEHGADLRRDAVEAAAEDLVEDVEVGGAVAEEDVDGRAARAVALRLGVAAELVECEARGCSTMRARCTMLKPRTTAGWLQAHARR